MTADLRRKLKELLIERLKFEDMTPDDIADDEPLFAGGLVFDVAQHGFLSGIDGFVLDRAIDAGDVVHIVVRLDAELGGLFRFTATGSIDGVDVARGRFTLAAPSHENA